MHEIPDSPQVRLLSALVHNLCDTFAAGREAFTAGVPAEPLKRAAVRAGTIGTIDWLASEIGCSERQARRYCRQRMVPGAYQVDRRGPWRIRKADARAWIDRIKTKLRA